MLVVLFWWCYVGVMLVLLLSFYFCFGGVCW